MVEKGAVSEPLVAEGQRDFHSLGCSGSHFRTPKFTHRFWTEFMANRALSDGTVVIPDEQYLRDLILLSKKQLASGYEAVMPTFQGQIGEERAASAYTELKEAWRFEYVSRITMGKTAKTGMRSIIQ